MREILLINISAPARRPVMTELAAVLSSDGVDVLDIAQAVIHEQLKLGLLVQLREAVDAGIIELIQHAMESMGAIARVTPISSARYGEWVIAVGDGRRNPLSARIYGRRYPLPFLFRKFAIRANFLRRCAKQVRLRSQALSFFAARSSAKSSAKSGPAYASRKAGATSLSRKLAGCAYSSVVKS